MNQIFAFLFPLLMLAVLLADLKTLRQRSRGVRWVYGCILALAFFYYLGRQNQWNLPVPTHWFVYHVSPVVETLLGTQ